MVVPRPFTIGLFALASLICALPASLLCPALQHPAPPAQVHPTGEPLDINTASPARLNALPGFGPVYTRRVIAGRPYSSKNQLFTRGVIPEPEYQRIAPLIIAHRPHR
ncbi:MAG: helix-hairpin-helix domain-containing protein [Acidobacteriaceae bacterium]